MVNKFVGYGISLAGIAVLFYSTFPEQIKLPVELPDFLQTKYLMVGGLILIILGVLLAMNEGKTKAPREVPIYHGEGKKRMIVGYKRMGK